MAVRPFVIVPSLMAIAVAYPQGRRIADLVAPRVGVDTESFRYIKYSQADAFQAPDTRVGRKSAPNQLVWGSEEITDSVQDHGLDAPVPYADITAWEKARQAGTGLVSQVDPKSLATELVMDAMLNRREFRTAQLISTLANYGTNNRVTLSGTGQWSDYTNSRPLAAIRGAMDNMLVRPTHAWMGRQVATILCSHPEVVTSVFRNQVNAGRVPVRALADELELEDIYVGDAFINTAAPGQPAALSRAWGKDFGLFHRNMQATTRGGLTFALTAQYGERIAGEIEDPDVGLRGGVRVRAGESVKELITANDLGYLFKAAVA